MTSPAPGTGQQVNFQTNVNRAKTKRWVEAKSYAYDGDDWGDGDEYEDEANAPQPDPQPAESRLPHTQTQMNPQNPAGQQHPGPQHPGPRYGDLSSRQPGPFGNRTATNPPPIHTRNQGSFDRGDDRRAFSATTGSFEGPYPTAQRAPFSATEQFPSYSNMDPRAGPPRGPPMSMGPQRVRGPSFDQEAFPRPPHMHDGRGGQYSDPRGGPYPGPMNRGRRSESGGRPPYVDMHDGRNSPSRAAPTPLSAVSQGSRDASPGKSFPPRKSSLSQQSGPADFQVPAGLREQTPESDSSTNAAGEQKPLPFIRPADIYKRMAEERERERRASEESSRPSLDDADSKKQGKTSLNPVTASTSTQNAEATSKVIDQAEPVREQQRVIGIEKATKIEGDHQAAPETLATRLTEPKDTSSLSHTPSVGFTSVVHQAFDESQSKVAPTPTSTSGDSVLRSNSASTSAISPIIDATSPDSDERPLSSSTLTPRATHSAEAQDSDPLPPPFRPGYRRDSQTPSPGNSPARRPLSVTTAEMSQEELGVLSNTTPTDAKALPQTPPTMSRSESPTKGTVRDLANKLEGRSSPSRSPIVEPARPVNARLESFRPALPGAWISYTTTGQSTPVHETAQPSSTEGFTRPKTPELEARPVNLTAGPPQPRAEEWNASGKAFEALSAAGSALTGAFGPSSATRHDRGMDYDSSAEAVDEVETPDTERAGGLSPVQEVVSVASNVAPPPPAKDTPVDPRSTSNSYFPSPLRTVKASDSPTPRAPLLPSLSTETSPHDTESDRLRKEIVLSLSPVAPKTSSHLRNEDAGESSHQGPVPSTGVLPALPGQQRGHEAPAESGFSVSQQRHDQEPGSRREVMSRIPSGPPMLQKKFSWEASSHKGDPLFDESARVVSSESTPRKVDQQGDVQQHPPPLQTEVKETQHVQTVPDASEASPENSPVLETGAVGGRAQSQEIQTSQYPSEDPSDRAAMLPGVRSPKDLREAASPPPNPDTGNLRQSVGSDRSARLSSEHKLVSSLPATPTDDVPAHSPVSLGRVGPGREVPFRDILALKTPQERIRAFKNSREQLAGQDSGLDQWIQTTGSQSKELEDFILQNGRGSGGNVSSVYTHKPSGSKTKFTRMGSALGTASPQSVEHTPSRSSPSGTKMSTQQMSGEGKKLLHSAGKFGGKAGGAAKGLFAKGKSKLRGSSGAGDKALTSSRRSSQPIIQIEEAQHSSDSATSASASAPQISPMKLRNPSNDTWSLSYAPSEPVSRSTTVDRPREKTALKYADLGPPSYTDNGAGNRNELRPPAPPSPQVSALGSVNQDGVPSRSISEVTRTDDSGENVEATGRAEKEESTGESTEDKKTESKTLEGSKTDQQILVGSSTNDTAAPILVARSDSGYLHSQSTTDVATLREPMTQTPTSQRLLSDAQNDPYSASTYSQPSPLKELRQPPCEVKPDTVPNEAPNESLSVGPGRPSPAVSAVSSQSPDPRAPEHTQSPPAYVEPPMSNEQRADSLTRRTQSISPLPVNVSVEGARSPVSVATDDNGRLGVEKAVRSPQISPLPQLSQAPPSQPQSAAQPVAPVVPVAPTPILASGLTAPRREGGSAQSGRPFSFVESNHDSTLHRRTPSKESQVSGTVSSLDKELGTETGSYSISTALSRTSNAPDLGQHPALRGTNDHQSPGHPRNDGSQTPSGVPGRHNTGEESEQYRIPGPYGQQFRAPRHTRGPSDQSFQPTPPLNPTVPQNAYQPIEQVATLNNNRQFAPNSAQYPPHQQVRPGMASQQAPQQPHQQAYQQAQLHMQNHQSMGHQNHPVAAQYPHPGQQQPYHAQVHSNQPHPGPGYPPPGHQQYHHGPSHPPSGQQQHYNQPPYPPPGSQQPSSPVQYYSAAQQRVSSPASATPKPWAAATSMFRPRSGSFSRQAAPDTPSSPQGHWVGQEPHERRGSFLKPGSRQSSQTPSSPFPGNKMSASGSTSGLSFFQNSSDQLDSPHGMNGMKPGKDPKTSKWTKHASISGSSPRQEGKKKGGFMRLSGLFSSKSSKDSALIDSAPRDHRLPVQRAVSLQPMPAQRGLGPHFVPHPGQQQNWNQQPPRPLYVEDPRRNSFRGQAPPPGGYYNPGGAAVDSHGFQSLNKEVFSREQQQPRQQQSPQQPREQSPQSQQSPPQPPRQSPSQSPPQPRDPSAFIGGRRLSEQRAAENAGLLQKYQGPNRNGPGENQYQYPRPQFAQVQPLSAPPTVPREDPSAPSPIPFTPPPQPAQSAHPLAMQGPPDPPASNPVYTQTVTSPGPPVDQVTPPLKTPMGSPPATNETVLTFGSPNTAPVLKSAPATAKVLPPLPLGSPRSQDFSPTPPHSAPPSAQHFKESQLQQPHAGSQRFHPDLRIDTSYSPNRRSQPVPLGRLRAHDPMPDRRVPPSEDPNPHLPRHSNSTPQRTSPYAERNQRSSYSRDTDRGTGKPNLSHAIDLHKRSRSPRGDGTVGSTASPADPIDQRDPASKLGTFSSTKRARSKHHRGRANRSPNGSDGGQEKPWKIDLPVGHDDSGTPIQERERDETGTAAQQMIKSLAHASAKNRFAGGTSSSSAHPSAGASATPLSPVELRGSRIDGDDSSDDSDIMKPTAYPGQEWVPYSLRYGAVDD